MSWKAIQGCSGFEKEFMAWLGNNSLACGLLLALLGNVIRTDAQSLDVRQGDGDRVILQASSDANVGYRIQGTSDFVNWTDVSDQASGAFSFFASTTNGNSFFRLETWTTDELPVTLVMVGDSTVADFASNSETFYGWGQGMYGYFKPNVRVINFGMPLQSTKSFLTSVQRQNLMQIKPEFVLVQLGMVDSYNLPGHTTTMPEYEANLKAIVQMVRDFKGTPILVTPPAVRLFGTDHLIATPEWLVSRRAVMRKVAADDQVYLVDLNESSTALYNELGPAESAYISWSESDPSHFSQVGADVIAGLVVDALPAILHSQTETQP